MAQHSFATCSPHRVSQAELSYRSRVSQPAISAIESGRRDPGFDTFEPLLCAVGYDINTVLG